MKKSKLIIRDSYTMNDYNFSIEPCLDGRKTIIDNERCNQIQDNCYPQNTIENDQIKASYLCEGNLPLNHFSSLLPFKNSLINDIMRRESSLNQRDVDDHRDDLADDNKNIFNCKLNCPTANLSLHSPGIIDERLMNQNRNFGEKDKMLKLAHLNYSNLCQSEVSIKSNALRLNLRNVSKSKAAIKRESTMNICKSSKLKKIETNVKFPCIVDKDVSLSEDEHKRSIVLSKVAKYLSKRLNNEVESRI